MVWCVCKLCRRSFHGRVTAAVFFAWVLWTNSTTVSLSPQQLRITDNKWEVQTATDTLVDCKAKRDAAATTLLRLVSPLAEPGRTVKLDRDDADNPTLITTSNNAKDNGTQTRFVCLPDTVDPRAKPPDH